jgi:hypothetical protein
MPTFRKIITEAGGAMIQESAEQGEVKFHIPSANFKALMHGLDEFVSESEIAIQKFSLTNQGGTQNSGFEGIISVALDKDGDGFSFKPFTEFSGLFVRQLPKPQIAKKENRSVPVLYSKIGEIQEGGKKWVFYRTSEGKIVRVEE